VRADSFHWQAVAVGDTCLFHTRGAALLRAFPLENSQQFSNAPKLVGARTSAEEVLDRCHVWPDGSGQSGDRLWLMTDALAQWCLAEHEAGGNPWAELDALLPSSAFGKEDGGEGVFPSRYGSGAGGEGILPSPFGKGAAAEGMLPSPFGRGAGGEGVLFAEWIEGLRSSRGLRNDDVTLLAIGLEDLRRANQ
jgi:hypothetical protein